MEGWNTKDWNSLPLQARLVVKTYLGPRDFTKLEETTWGENTKSKERCLGLQKLPRHHGTNDQNRIRVSYRVYNVYRGYQNPAAPWND